MSKHLLFLSRLVNSIVERDTESLDTLDSPDYNERTETVQRRENVRLPRRSDVGQSFWQILGIHHGHELDFRIQSHQ